MYLFGIHVNDLKDTDILRLKESAIPESKTLDYKATLGLKEEDKAELLYDITSFYNTDGGCIIYGIREQKDSGNQNLGIPGEIVGLDNLNEDKVKQKLEDWIRSNVEPRSVHVSMKYNGR
jgi:predicted HTH transcriptional regulator